MLPIGPLTARRTTHVPVGEDQQQHIEFARSMANSFNHAYAPVFEIPEPVICDLILTWLNEDFFF